VRIAVVGAGGVGGYFGGRLALAGHDVAFIARGAHLKAIREHGLRVESINGDFTIAPAEGTDDPAGVGRVDAAIVAVKTWQLPEVARAMRPLVGPATVVLPLLNGVEASDQLAEVLGRDHVLGGLCRIIAEIVEPGHIRHPGVDPSVILGELDDRRTERVGLLRRAFVDAGVRAEIAPAIQAALWEKFMMIATVSAIGAVTRVPAGAWRTLPGTRAMAEASLREVVAVASARGVKVAPDKVAATMAFIDAIPSTGTASMQRDIMDGKPSELESQSGAVVRLGAEAGVPTPTHDFLYHALLPQERAARGR
jgi:2-dehydropantoate 2-reductase